MNQTPAANRVCIGFFGKRNSGKSSLLNALTGQSIAVVSDVPGTTTDPVSKTMELLPIGPVVIIDTAGIRNASDEVERIGVQKAIEIAKKSDVVIAIFDISRPLNKEDQDILELLKDKNSIILLNKIDLDRKVSLDEIKRVNKPIVEISTKTREGLEELYSEISKLFKLKEIANDGETIVSNVRHKNIIINSRKNLNKARETIRNNMPIDIISGHLKEIIEELGKITGETVTEDVIAEIFSKFCLGK